MIAVEVSPAMIAALHANASASGAHHLRSEFSTYTRLLEPMMERAGFEIVAADHSADEVHAAYLCIRGKPPLRE